MSKLNWKSIVGWGIAALVVAGIIGTNMYQEKENNPNSKKVVYAFYPLTGTVANLGKEAQKYTQIWEKLHPEAPFRIEYIDSESKPDRAVSALNQILLKEKDPIVISLFSFIGKATIPIIEKTDGFIFAPATIISMGEGVTHYQRIGSSVSDAITPLVNYVKTNQKVGIINLDDEYGTLNANYFKDEILKKGAHLTIQETLRFRDLDVRIPVYKVLESKPDVVYVTGTASMAYSNIFKELSVQEFKGIVLADNAFQNKSNLDNIAGINLHVFAAIPPMDDFKTNYPQAVKEIQNAKMELYYLPAEIFDTFDLINYTFENNLPFTQETYTKMGKWKGVIGDMILPGNGDSLYPFILVQYKNGEFVPVTE